MVEAHAYGGYSSQVNELIFGVPMPEATATPEPTPTEPPMEESRILYIDASSTPEDVQTVQMALYTHGLINADAVQIGMLDEATLSAVAAFQQKVNELYGANLYVINPAMDIFIDQGTLDYLLYQDITING